ncbi:SIR2 family protein [Aeromonas allosaccharophila]|uniref:SIR2 family protein n=1 Tax=Aeromonas allosaccharophila TaxID=656 RepID=UPI003D20A25C
MDRKLLIFGNGLGMSLDPAHFSLSAALESIWDRDNFLSLEQKRLIARCLGREGAPQGEDELDLLHQVVTHCRFLNFIGNDDVHWLTAEGQSFPDITATYLHKVATKLHNYNGFLPQHFEEALVRFIRNTKSHVATLNYDKLLYNSFIDNNLVNGYDGCLIDGMLNRGFSADALERRFDNDFGYYLHLHGSPLFIENEGSILKLTRDQLNLQYDVPSRHIVLTHVKHKPSVIAASHALSTYWDYLQFALSEAEEIILFGYSGFDKHLNMLLKPYLRTIPLRVVEWSGAGEQAERENYWNRCFGRRVTVERLDNISNFTNW